MSPVVRFRLAGGTVVDVGEGGINGRGLSAQLRLTDPGVSEAHALVTLRGRELRIMALRGRVVINDVPVSEATLRVGQRVVLSAGTVVTVVGVEVPPAVAEPMLATVGGEARLVVVQLGAGTVRIQEGDDPAVQLGGNQAELFRLLADASEPMHWSQIARYFWPERDQIKWRERFDAMMKEVRGKFRDHRIRGDLLWSWDGSYSLKLNEGDVVVRVE